MRLIPIWNKDGITAYTMVDDDDYERLSGVRWNMDTDGYAVHHTHVNGKKKRTKMARLIMGEPKNMEVDHMDHNVLNNQKSNLRVGTRRENGQNMKIFNMVKSSKYKGVCWHKAGKKWLAYIGSRTTNSRKYLGLFVSEESAALAYNRAAIEMFGEWANLNPVTPSVTP